MNFRDAYLDWPSEVSIETYTKCNASCTFCPYVTLERIGNRMPDEMIDRIIDELKDHPAEFVISPFKVNEPLLDKRFTSICRKINAELPQAYLRLFTNGSALTDRYISEIASFDRVMHLWISLNDHDPVRYNETMGLDFERATANLDALWSAKENGHFPHNVVISKVRESNERDAEFIEYVKARWPSFSTMLIKKDAWIGYTSSDTGEVPDKPCGRWFEVNIMSDGKVALCCMDGTGEHSIGDLNKNTLFEVYNQRQQRERRRFMLSRLSAGSPCNGCTY